MTHEPKKKHTSRSLFFKLKENGSDCTLDSLSEERPIPPSFQLAVLIAMPIPLSERRLMGPADGTEMNVGTIRVPFIEETDPGCL